MNSIFTKRFVSFLRSIVAQNEHLNILDVDFSDDNIRSQVRLHGIPVSREEAIEGLMGAQRLLRILPREDAHHIWPLFDQGFSSAIEIASLTKSRFIEVMVQSASLTAESAAVVYANACAKRAAILPQFMTHLQNTEPHIQQASF